MRVLAFALFFVSCISFSSTWVVNSSLNINTTIPLPSLDDVSVAPFQYGVDSQLNLAGLGDTSHIYYQLQTYHVDTGLYQDSSWQCVAKDTLIDEQLILPLSSGRYKVKVVAVMASEQCQSAELLLTGGLIASSEYISNEFVVINHQYIDFEVNNQAQAYIVQSPYLDNNGHLSSYDLHLDWPSISGIEKYQLTIYKNSMPTIFTITHEQYL